MSYGTTEIIASALDAAAWEMCANLIRTAYSPNVKERADCSTALCDARGRTLALATHGPAHLGSALQLVPAIVQRFPLEAMRPGDVFFANDPYTVGVTHLNDCTMAAPVFASGRLIGFAIALAHHSDVGGKVPGSESGDATSIFQEGIRLPPVRLYAGGELCADVLELFLLNSRTPHFSQGDIHAQRAAIASGIQRLQGLYERYGADVMDTALKEMMDATEQRLRHQIGSQLRDGVYSAGDHLDEDGASGRPVALNVEITVAGDRLIFDFSGCSPQLASGKNVPYTHTMATVYYCMKVMTDPGVALNEGLYRPIEVIAPEGSVVNPRAPAGVSSRNLTSMILADVIIQALGQAVPERARAASGPYQGIILGGWDAQRQRYFVDYENFAGGHGADAAADGMDAAQIHMTNTANLPIEVMEMEFPVQVVSYEIVPDSGGAGRHRGGCGVRRALRMLADGTTLSVRSARQLYAAQGLAQGEPGALGAYLLLGREGKADERLPSTFSERPLRRGDVLMITTPGGGGYGDPRLRDVAAVARDVAEGKVSRTRAETSYGVVLDRQGVVDIAATATLRGSS